jgi:hypothetical protein
VALRSVGVSRLGTCKNDAGLAAALGAARAMLDETAVDRPFLLFTDSFAAPAR